jgi:hypothetical protein
MAPWESGDLRCHEVGPGGRLPWRWLVSPRLPTVDPQRVGNFHVALESETDLADCAEELFRSWYTAGEQEGGCEIVV